jgi:hypothetical protein
MVYGAAEVLHTFLYSAEDRGERLALPLERSQLPLKKKEI